MDWEVDYSIVPVDFLRRLSLNLKTWCTSVEEDAGEIDLPNLISILFKIYRRTFDAPNMPSPYGAP